MPIIAMPMIVASQPMTNSAGAWRPSIVKVPAPGRAGGPVSDDGAGEGDGEREGPAAGSRAIGGSTPPSGGVGEPGSAGSDGVNAPGSRPARAPGARRASPSGSI
jgi:hypothetical protein